MFTGIIEEIGVVKNKLSLGGGFRFTFSAAKILEDVKTGDSINVNGVCQTVVSFDNNTFSVDTVEETLKKTTMQKFNYGQKVNLERSMHANGRFGGHFVLGHVDVTGKITEIKNLPSSHLLKISYPQKFSQYLIPVGSICIDGISLTLAEVQDSNFTVSVIPLTWQGTNLSAKRIGDEVNLEFDVIGKYVAKSLGKDSSKITEQWLRDSGF